MKTGEVDVDGLRHPGGAKQRPEAVRVVVTRTLELTETDEASAHGSTATISTAPTQSPHVASSRPNASSGGIFSFAVES